MLRHKCLYLSFLSVLFVLCTLPLFAESPKWYKGNLHCHSYWSDGRLLPEQVADWYKDRGYNFVCISDHGDLQTRLDNWKQVGKLDGKAGIVASHLKKYQEKYGDWVDTKEENDMTWIRLKPISELKEKMDEPGRFILLPGHELNGGVPDRSHHGGVVNVSNTLKFQKGLALKDSIKDCAIAAQKASKEENRKALYIHNHPLWPQYETSPQDLIETPECRFFELLNMNASPKTRFDEFWTVHQFWDIINAFRSVNGDPLLYGLAADDAHVYDSIGRPGSGWIYVRSSSLEPDALCDAMNQGDFIASNGVEVEDVNFDPKSRTLSVKVKPEAGVRYTISFIGTEKDFDRTVKVIDIDRERVKGLPERVALQYSDDIGKTFATVEGTEASYTLKDNDLYVRAVITSDQSVPPSGLGPKTKSAWTQPVR